MIVGDASRVRIIGGSLSGILAAFEAHRLGCRDIVLHERYETLGGSAWPRMAHGLELRPGRLYFGPRGDPARALLESHGLAFDDVENRFGSVSPAPARDVTVTHGFAGPALRARELALSPLAGESLNDRLRAYPDEIREPLARYCQWRLGAWLDEVHGSAADLLGLNRVFPLGHEPVRIAALKRSDPFHDELYGLPASLWGRLENLTASLPQGGFAAFFDQCRRALAAAGVEVHVGSMVSPRQAAVEREAHEILVWAADPTPLYDLSEIEPPRPVGRSLATYTFKARYGGPAPFHVRDFSAAAALLGVYLYESRGQVLVLAECREECADAELRRDIHRLMAGFAGASLSLGELVATGFSRLHVPTMEAMRKQKGLRADLAGAQGGGLVAAGWDAGADVGEQLASLRAELSAALDRDANAAAA